MPKFFIHAWHEDDHEAIMKFPLHVRIIVENLPMQFWSLERRTRRSAISSESTAWTAGR